MWYVECLPIFLTNFRLSSFSHSFNFLLVVLVSPWFPLWVPRRVIHGQGCSSPFPWAPGEYQMEIWTFKTLSANGKNLSSFYSSPLSDLMLMSMAAHRVCCKGSLSRVGNGLSWAKGAPKSCWAVQALRWQEITDFLKAFQSHNLFLAV